MNSGATTERVHAAVKRRLLTGRYRPGERIEVAALANALDSSATPVRDALHLLVGERLVETRAGDGFHVPQIDAPALSDLYAWNAQILLVALRTRAGDRGVAEAVGNGFGATDNGERAALVFKDIAQRAGNPEYVRAIESNNDRLYAARVAEAHMRPNWQDELDAIWDALRQANMRLIRKLIVNYHRDRIKRVLDIIRLIQHGG